MSDKETVIENDTEATGIDTGTRDNPESPNVDENATVDNAADIDRNELEAAIEQARTEALEEAQREHETLTQELTSQIDQFRIDNAALQRNLDLTIVAQEQGVPRELLHGETRQEMELYAAALKSWRAERPVEKTPVPISQLKSGANLREPLSSSPKQSAVDAVRANF